MTETNPADEVWLGDDLERAYQQALQAADAVDWPIGELSESSQTADETETPPQDTGAQPENGEAATPDGPDSVGEPAENVEAAETTAATARDRVTPKQIIEAALFVGGVPLTIKKLCSLLRGKFDQDSVEATIDELNDQYSSENRPYEILFGEGGYRLVLRPEFEPVRNRVFGLGPKEVKLSQEALEVLALVAYRQPISVQDIEASGKKNPGGMLRQLLRRELIAIERPENRRKDVTYHTTPRFLQLFGLGHIDELPQAEELSLK